MLHLLSAPLAAVLLFASPEASQPVVGTVEAAASVRAALPTFALSALLDKPELKLGETHRVVAQLCGEREQWHPYLTRFHADDYRCVTLWADEQWLWIKEEFEAPAAELFVRRGSAADQLLMGSKRHDRFALKVCVREIHAGRAWIEIEAARPTEQQTPEGTVLHAIRAMDLIEREGWTLAISQLERALRPNLPGHVRRELETVLELCEAALE